MSLHLDFMFKGPSSKSRHMGQECPHIKLMCLDMGFIRHISAFMPCDLKSMSQGMNDKFQHMKYRSKDMKFMSTHMESIGRPISGGC